MQVQKDSLPIENTQRLLRYRWVVFGILAASQLAIFFTWVVPATIGTRLASEWNLSATTLGLLGSFVFYPYAIMQVPAGYITDTAGPRKAVTFAMLIMGVGQIVFSLATSLAVGLLGRALTGLGGGMVLIAILKILVAWFRRNEFATMVGLNGTIGFGGAILGTAPLAFVVAQAGWRLPLLVMGGVTLLLAILNWVLVRDDPRELDMPGIDEIDSTPRPSAGNGTAPVKSSALIKEAFLTWRRTPTVWLISLIFLLGFGSFQSFQYLWAGPYLIHVHGKTAVEAGASLWLLSVGGGLGPLVSGFLSDRVFQARRPFLIAGALGLGLGWAWILSTTDGATTTVINMTFLLFSFSGGVSLICQPMVKECVRSEIFGTVFGFVNMFPFVGNSVYQVIMGVILNSSGSILIEGSRVYSAMGYWLAFLPAFIGCTLAVVIVLFVPESMQRDSHPP